MQGIRCPVKKTWADPNFSTDHSQWLHHHGVHGQDPLEHMRGDGRTMRQMIINMRCLMIIIWRMIIIICRMIINIRPLFIIIWRMIIIICRMIINMRALFISSGA